MRLFVLALTLYGLVGHGLTRDLSSLEALIDEDELMEANPVAKSFNNEVDDSFAAEDASPLDGDEENNAGVDEMTKSYDDEAFETAVRKRGRRHKNCGEIKKARPKALSGVYTIGTNIGRVRVYCEMAIKGGPYTFFPRNAIRSDMRRHLDLSRNIHDKDRVLLRYQDTDTSQPYTILRQLNQNQDTPLFMDVNANPGYNTPVNKNLLDGAYIYVAFLSKAQGSNNNIQGFASNGQQITFRNCDKNPNSYFAFFPDHNEKTPSTYHQFVYPLTKKWLASAHQLYSERTMPNDYFFFLEQHFGGCGAYWQSNRHATNKPIKGVAVGFA